MLCASFLFFKYVWLKACKNLFFNLNREFFMYDFLSKNENLKSIYCFHGILWSRHDVLEVCDWIYFCYFYLLVWRQSEFMLYLKLKLIERFFYLLLALTPFSLLLPRSKGWIILRKIKWICKYFWEILKNK
jgi:hypothetical protein